MTASGCDAEVLQATSNATEGGVDVRMLSLWLLSLVLVGILASAVTAQVARTPPRIVTGADLGFRVEGKDVKGRPVGSIVIRVDGEWVEPGPSMKVTPATTR